jgi:hypothetical protein
MKKYLFLYMVLILGSFCVFDCSKKEQKMEKAAPVESAFQMSCTIDGKDWKCDENTSYADKTDKEIKIHCQKMFQNSAGATDFDYFDFKIQAEQKTGEYPFTTGGINNCIYVPGGPQILKYNAGSGKLVILKLDNEKLEGTFEFLAATEDGKSASISGGKFSGKFRVK